MKLSFIQGKAVVIAGIEINDAMSAFGISGNIPAIREIKVGPREMGNLFSPDAGCSVKVIFWEDLYVKIFFGGNIVYNEKSPDIHWFVTRVVTYYHGDSMDSRNLYLY